MVQTPFPVLLKTKREAAGHTQKSLADEAELSNGSIGFYETGRQKPRIENLIKIFDALSLSKSERAQWLLATGLSLPNDSDGELERIPEEAQQHAYNYSKLRPTSRRMLERMAEDLAKIERGEMGINDDDESEGAGHNGNGSGRN